jgi:membrane fusion protein, multidrug efflux system
VSKPLLKAKLLFISVCFLAVAILLVSCTKKGPTGAQAAMMMMMMQAVPVRAVPAVATDVPLEVSGVGNVEAVATVDVKSRVAGQVVRVNFQEGQDVRQGELLFEIDPEPLLRQVAQIQADLGKDSALEQQARANVVKDEAMLKQNRAQADRGLALAKEGIFSKEQTEQVVATADSAQAALDADKAAVESAVASLKADRARLEQTNLQLSYTKITAPITGRAGAIAVKAGNLVKDNDTALVTILQVSPIYVSFGVPEQLLPEVRKYSAGHPILIEASADGQKTLTGTLRFIDSSVDTSTGMIKLKALFDNPERVLWPGQFVNVQARLRLEHNRIVIPSRTIQTGPQGKYVWVMNQTNATVAMRPVQVLRNYQPPKASEEAVIGNGLEAGEMVISEGQMRLAPGAKVRLLKSDTQLGNAGPAEPSSIS